MFSSLHDTPACPLSVCYSTQSKDYFLTCIFTSHKDGLAQAGDIQVVAAANSCIPRRGGHMVVTGGLAVLCPTVAPSWGSTAPSWEAQFPTCLTGPSWQLNSPHRHKQRRLKLSPYLAGSYLFSAILFLLPFSISCKTVIWMGVLLPPLPVLPRCSKPQQSGWELPFMAWSCAKGTMSQPWGRCHTVCCVMAL